PRSEINGVEVAIGRQHRQVREPKQQGRRRAQKARRSGWHALRSVRSVAGGQDVTRLPGPTNKGEIGDEGDGPTQAAAPGRGWTVRAYPERGSLRKRGALRGARPQVGCPRDDRERALLPLLHGIHSYPDPRGGRGARACRSFATQAH